jgi:TolB-like protein
MSLFAELKRRNVVRVGLAYIIIGWVLAQVAEFAFETFGAPDWVLKVFVVILLLGLPLALFFSWAFELTPDGIKREADVDRDRSITSKTGRKLDFAIIAFLAVGLIYFFWESRIRDPGIDHQATTSETAGLERRQAIGTAEKEAPSIAVLPFVNMSDDESQDYFADGLSEELLNLLARTKGLKVSARTSSFAFKGQNRPIGEIAEILNVTTVLEGSVRRSGDRIRVTAQLINAADGYHLWSQTYDRQMSDIFELQDDIAGEIFSSMRGQLGAGSPVGRGRPTDNVEAYNLYLQALARLRVDDYVRAKDLLLRTIELAPDFAEAHEKLALTWWSLAGDVIDLKQAMTLTLKESGIALSLDPTLGHARALYLGSDMENYDRLAELQAYEQLIAENPANSKAQAGLMYTLLILGYFDEAVRVGKNAVAIDPLYGNIRYRLAQAYFAVEDSERARNEAKASAGFGVFSGHYVAVLSSILEGDDEQAIEYMSLLDDLPESYLERMERFLRIGRDPDNGAEKLREALEGSMTDYREFGYLFVAMRMLDEAYDHLEYLGAFQPPQTNAELPIQDATVLTGSGFTAHPRYVEMATAYGLASVWDRRGAPDHCSKTDGQWTCH